jgi:hypothetical protein
MPFLSILLSRKTKFLIYPRTEGRHYVELLAEALSLLVMRDVFVATGRVVGFRVWGIKGGDRNWNRRSRWLHF